MSERPFNYAYVMRETVIVLNWSCEMYYDNHGVREFTILTPRISTLKYYFKIYHSKTSVDRNFLINTAYNHYEYLHS